MMLTNGYHNSASFDRIRDDDEYREDNIEIRPRFLNTQYKLTTQDLRELVLLRENAQDKLELITIAKYINEYNTLNFFYDLAEGIKQHSNERKTFEFKLINECAYFLIKKYVNQGGRCFYSQIPMYPEVNYQYKISPERLNPTGPYSQENIVLIIIELNGPLSGQYLNKNLTEEQRQEALEAGQFN